jgi:hypothetical protein
MKNRIMTRLVFMASMAIITISCGEYTNEEQRNFDGMRREYTKKYNEASNDIVRQELYTEYKQKYCDFFKSIQNKNSSGNIELKEWEGEIASIKFISDVLEFSIICRHGEDETTTFHCGMSDILTNNTVVDSKANFKKIYDIIKTLKVSDTVLFSGNLEMYEICEERFSSTEIYLSSFYSIYITDLRKK